MKSASARVRASGFVLLLVFSWFGLGSATAAKQQMDFSDLDRAPMHALNEILWKSVKVADSPMPPPVHRYRTLVGE